MMLSVIPIFFRLVEFSRVNFWLTSSLNQIVSTLQPASGGLILRGLLIDTCIKGGCSFKGGWAGSISLRPGLPADNVSLPEGSGS